MFLVPYFVESILETLFKMKSWFCIAISSILSWPPLFFILFFKIITVRV